MKDRLENGRKVRCFNVIDDANREILHVEIDYSLKSKRVIWVLNHLMKRRKSKPNRVRMDNGPEFIAKAFVGFCNEKQIKLNYIQPGKPAQNAYIERFNRTLREDILDAYLFETIEQINMKAY